MQHGTGRVARCLIAASLVITPMLGCSPSADPQPEPADSATTQAEEPSSAPAAPSTETPAQSSTQNLVPIGQSANKDNFEQLLMELVTSYESPSTDDVQALEATLMAIRGVAEPDYGVAQSIVGNWQSVFANPNYQLFLYGGGEQTIELAQSGIQDTPSHAFVVMGFQLENGEMGEELKARCDAAAAAARTYPNTIIVCSGGATGLNNPEGHTEAGVMKAYLTEVCGIDPSRIHIDETSQDTAQNAMNTLAILRSQGVQTYTIVTSAYHQAWAQAVYNTAAALSARDNEATIGIVGNYNVDFPLTEVAPGTEDRWAVEQMAEVLGLPKEEMQQLLWS